jgi:hypothetical protein
MIISSIELQIEEFLIDYENLTKSLNALTTSEDSSVHEYSVGDIQDTLLGDTNMMESDQDYHNEDDEM